MRQFVLSLVDVVGSDFEEVLGIFVGEVVGFGVVVEDLFGIVGHLGVDDFLGGVVA